MFKRFLDRIKNYISAFFFGMKNTEEMFFTQSGASLEGTSIQQQVTSNRVSQALLRGELTQEVKELRYRTYKVDSESKQYKYYAPTLAFKKTNKIDSKFVKYENADNLEVITIQPNNALTEGVLETLEHANAYGKVNKYIINIERDCISRYKIEEYTTRIVVKKKTDTTYVLDFYVSIYPNDKDFKSKGFVREVEKIKNEKLRSDILDFNEVSFVTNHAYNIDDMVKFIFIHPYYKEVIEYDGHYIIRFNAQLKSHYNLTDDFYCKEMDEKYKNNEKKDVVYDILGGHTFETYYCDECGKEIRYDTQAIDDIETTAPRGIDEEQPTSSVTSYMDIQISEQTFGKRLCKECIEKHLK